jgi:hypothetical protein
MLSNAIYIQLPDSDSFSAGLPCVGCDLLESCDNGETRMKSWENELEKTNSKQRQFPINFIDPMYIDAAKRMELSSTADGGVVRDISALVKSPPAPGFDSFDWCRRCFATCAPA